MTKRQCFQPDGDKRDRGVHHAASITLSKTMCAARSEAQMEMRRAVARTRAARMTAEGDDFALFVAAIGIAAIAVLQLNQRKTARLYPDAT